MRKRRNSEILLAHRGPLQLVLFTTIALYLETLNSGLSFGGSASTRLGSANKTSYLPQFAICPKWWVRLPLANNN